MSTRIWTNIVLSLMPSARAIRRRPRRLREGQFHFSLSEQPPKKIGAREIAPETLAVGIHPQELLLDLARGMDEDRRDSSQALEAGLSLNAVSPSALRLAPPLVVTDDDVDAAVALLAELIGAHLGETVS